MFISWIQNYLDFGSTCIALGKADLLCLSVCLVICHLSTVWQNYAASVVLNIVAAFQGMHVSPAKHSYVWLPRKVWLPDRQTHRQMPDKVIPMCRYASQATQKVDTCPDCSHGGTHPCRSKLFHSVGWYWNSPLQSSCRIISGIIVLDQMW